MPSSAQPPIGVTLSLLQHRRPLRLTASRAFVLCRIANDAGVDAETRPVRLIVALDRSGSMEGDKMRSAQATLTALLAELGPEDRFALVAFDDHVEVAVAPTSMTASAKALVSSAVPSIGARGSTDLSAAILRSLALAREAGGEPWHVIVLTDGAPTTGVTNEDQILTLAGGAAGTSTLSTFGYGDDVRSELLGRLSDLGKGQYHFVQGCEAPVAAFASELGRQRALFGVEVGLRLTLGGGVALSAVPKFAKASAPSADGSVDLELGPLLCGDTTSLVVALKLGPEALALDANSPWLQATLTFRAVADGSLRTVETSLVPLLATEDGPYVAEVARELATQRAAELIHAAARTPLAELQRDHASLLALVKESGVGADPQVLSALALLAQTLEGLADAGTRVHAAAQAASLSRGIYHGEVTSLGGHAYTRQRTMTGIDRIVTSMAGPPPPPPKKPKGE